MIERESEKRERERGERVSDKEREGREMGESE